VLGSYVWMRGLRVEGIDWGTISSSSGKGRIDYGRVVDVVVCVSGVRVGWWLWRAGYSGDRDGWLTVLHE
jgi:hypothetical protein